MYLIEIGFQTARTQISVTSIAHLQEARFTKLGQMRGTTALSSARNILKQMYPIRGTWVSTSVSKKQKNDLGDGERPTMNDKAEPELIVAFNKPPLPPVLGPFIVLSLLEMGSSGNDD
ncbi:uncharacterized protein LOC122665125 [Telopea speciosissima]|uniref:uncharacterized protein LOC122665125 n=1 Tax=Telopea speciosissima TaxID=54955 RepID=UPI001CC62EE8|nr:uncharacterized protein LOC122665125 [Telopea speciosissima]